MVVRSVVWSRFALHEAGHAVRMCVRTPFDHLVVDTADGTRHVPVEVSTHPGDVGPVDWVILTVKAHQTEGAADWLGALTGVGTTVVVLQNGVDQIERVRPFAPHASILPALGYVQVERTAPGRIRHGYGARIVAPAGARGQALAELFEGGPVRVELEADFVTAAWRKLMLNVAANPVTALTVRRMEVFDDEPLRDLALALMMETVRVGRAAGAKINAEDAHRTLKFFQEFAEGNGTSMLYDRLAGVPLEIDALNGAVVRLGKRYGTDVPLNQAVWALVRAIRPHKFAVDDHCEPGRPRLDPVPT